jgi:hypothetical protein
MDCRSVPLALQKKQPTKISQGKRLDLQSHSLVTKKMELDHQTPTSFIQLPTVTDLKPDLNL